MFFFLSILIAFSLEIGVKCGRAVFFSAHLFQSVPLRKSSLFTAQMKRRFFHFPSVFDDERPLPGLMRRHVFSSLFAAHSQTPEKGLSPWDDVARVKCEETMSPSSNGGVRVVILEESR